MKQDELLETIRDYPVFSQFEEEQLENLVEHATLLDIPKNAMFFTEEKYAKGMHILLSGRVKLFKLAEDGKEQTIFVFGPGEPFCLCSVFSDGEMPAHLGALEDSTVLRISPEHFAEMVKEDPTVLLNMLRVMARRLKEAMDMIDSLSLKQVPSRLAAYFLSREQDGVVEMDISYRELSKIIGATPEALSRSLKRMGEEGLLETDGKRVHLLDRDGLATI